MCLATWRARAPSTATASGCAARTASLRIDESAHALIFSFPGISATAPCQAAKVYPQQPQPIAVISQLRCGSCKQTAVRARGCHCLVRAGSLGTPGCDRGNAIVTDGSLPMAQIFHRSFNVVSKVTIFGTVFILIALGYVL